MNAKMGRQYVLQSSASAMRAVASPAVESAQARTMLQRVVENRSGDRLPCVTISGVTVYYHRIYWMLGKLKPRRRAVSGPRPSPRPLFYHLLTIRGSIGGCLSIVLLRKIGGEVFEKVMEISEVVRLASCRAEGAAFRGRISRAWFRSLSVRNRPAAAMTKAFRVWHALHR